jgi:hypothetical protein
MSLASNTLTLLSERVARLDQALDRHGHSEMGHFVAVMGSITHTQLTASSSATPSPIVDPRDADKLVAACELLGALAELDRSIVDGPVDTRRQEWIAVSSRLRRGRSARPPARQDFLAPAEQLHIPLSTKPFNLGLYTSTALARGAPSMWRAYLNEYGGGPILLPRPWYSWRMQPEDRELTICEISSACDWVAFVTSYAVRDESSLYPDWNAAANDFDAIHVTARAVVAMQGFRFPDSTGYTAPAYWDVESTFWLRWPFKDAKLVGVEP